MRWKRGLRIYETVLKLGLSRKLKSWYAYPGVHYLYEDVNKIYFGQNSKKSMNMHIHTCSDSTHNYINLCTPDLSTTEKDILLFLPLLLMHTYTVREGT